MEQLVDGRIAQLSRVDREEMKVESSSWQVQKHWNCTEFRKFILRFEGRADYHEQLSQVSEWVEFNSPLDTILVILRGEEEDYSTKNSQWWPTYA